MKFFLYLLIPIFLFCDTGKNLKETNSDVFDLTYQDVNNITEIEPDKFLEKVFISVPKDEILTLRTPFVFNCGKDKYNNSYCPSQLAKAREYWSYDDGFSKLKTGTVTDYTDKIIQKNYTYKKKIYSKIFYKDFTLLRNTFINIYNNILIKHSGGKNGTGYLIYYNNYKISERGEGYRSKIIDNMKINFKISSNGNNRSSSIRGLTIFIKKCPKDYISTVGEEIVKGQCKKVIQIKECPKNYTLTTANETTKGECKKEINYSYYDYKCSDSSNEQNHNFNEQNIGGDCNKVDTDNTKVNNELAESCNSATPPKNNCKRKEYACNSNEIKPAFVDGEWKCSPFQCNSNMKCGYGSCNGMKTSNDKIMPYAYHPIESLTRSGDACTPIPCDTEYEYDDGIATKVDKDFCSGEIVNGKCFSFEYKDKINRTNTKCKYVKNITSHGDGVMWYGGRCAAMDEGNCSDRDVENWLSDDICLRYVGPKILEVCPSGYEEFGDSKRCRKGTELPMKNYSYYKYECKDDKNSFGEKWELTQGANDPGCVDDTFGGCTDFTKETSVCRRQIHTCPNGSGTCKKNNNGQYQCSLDNCKDGKMPCIGQLCDYVAFDRISYCLDYKCPTGAGFSEKDGKCLKEECPEGTYLVNGKCLDSKF